MITQVWNFNFIFPQKLLSCLKKSLRIDQYHSIEKVDCLLETIWQVNCCFNRFQAFPFIFQIRFFIYFSPNEWLNPQHLNKACWKPNEEELFIKSFYEWFILYTQVMKHCDVPLHLQIILGCLSWRFLMIMIHSHSQEFLKF